ncbi:MAG: outer membrane protein assembly factor [Candidatus Bipolaricaulia bacterium]
MPHKTFTLQRAALVVALVASLIGGFAFLGAAQDGAESQTAKVAQIQVQGNTHVDTSRIRSALPFAVDEKITLPDDIKRAQTALMDVGLFQNVSVDYRMAENGIIVIVDVTENPVVQKIEITGNTNYNADQQLHIPVVDWNVPWPFVDYLVTTERLKEILKKNGIETGKVLNTKKLRTALGINKQGQCKPNPPTPSICHEYQNKGYSLVGFNQIQPGETLRIGIVEAVIESVQVQGVEGPFKEKAKAMLSGIPNDRPAKQKTIQQAVQSLNESIFFRVQQVGPQPGSSPDKLKLLVRLAPRTLIDKPQTIDEIRFEGVTAFSTSELQSRLALPEGELTNFELLQALQDVYELYRDDGFMMATFARQSLENGILTLEIREGRINEILIKQNGYQTARITPKQGMKELSIDASAKATESGEKASQQQQSSTSGGNGGIKRMVSEFGTMLGQFLGTASTSDLPRTEPEIIRTQLTFSAGDLANQFRLQESYRRLQKLGYFSSVNYNFERLDSGGVRVIISTEEKQKTGSLNGGFSVSGKGLVGQLSLSGKNLYGLGQDVSISVDRGVVGQTATNFNLDYQGRLLVPGTDSLNINVYNKTSRKSSSDKGKYWLRRRGGKASLTVPVSGDAQAEVGMRQEWVKKEFLDQQNLTPESSRVSVASLSFNQDDRNNPRFATRGGQRQISIERAGLFGVGTPFTKIEGTIVQHWPTIENQTFALRLVGKAGSRLPAQEEFTLGSASTVRSVETVRGPSIGFANLEYRILLEPQANVSVAFFADIGTDGDVWRKSVGVEGRLTAPYVGPVRLAMAWPITDRVKTVQAVFGFGTFF